MFLFFVKEFIFREVLIYKKYEFFDFIILIVLFLNINIVMLYLYKMYCNI